ncbi:MAG: hypothetical protein N2712_02195 [Brevinematales bacterium]|nr:hypothetical protein [Brevinematales bacterium]
MINRAILSAVIFGIVGLFIVVGCGGNVRKIEQLGLEASLQQNGNIVITTPYIKYVVSPSMGGRVMSVVDLRTGSEIVETYNETDSKMGGAFYDILDFIWPGTAERKYVLEDWGVSSDKKIAFVKLSYTVGQESDKARGLKVTKYLYSDNIDPVIKGVITVENVSGQDKKFTYWHQTRPILGDPNNTDKTIYLDIQGEASDIRFEPGSGGRGDIMTEGNYFAFVSPKASNTLLIVVDKGRVSKFWSWHDVKLPTFDILFKEVSLKPGEKVTYNIDWAVIPTMQNVSYADRDSGVVIGYDLPKSANPGSDIKLPVYVASYKSDNFKSVSRVLVIFRLEDSVGREISRLTSTNLFNATPRVVETKVLSVQLPDVKGGYYYVVADVFSTTGEKLFSTKKAIKIGEISIPKFDKKLRLVFIWTLHQPLYNDPKLIKQNLSSFLPVYSSIVKLYLQRETPVCISITGSLLYQLAYYYPKQLEEFRKLFSKNNVELMITSFSYSLLPFVDEAEMYRSLLLDRDFKDNYLGSVNIKGVWLPEMAFSEKVILPIIQVGGTWVPISDLAVDTGFAGWGLNYHIPYRLTSKASAINTIIVDTRASRILYKKTDRSIDEFIQYLIQLNEKNKDGNMVLAVADNGESIGDGIFFSKLFDRLEKIPWVRIVKGEDVFRETPPIKDLIAEKIIGGWYYDPEEKRTSFRLWFDTKIKRDIWELCNSTSKDIIKVMDNFKQAEEVGVDISYPNYLYNNAWKHLIIARDSGWLWMGSELGVSIVKSQLDKSRYFLKDIYTSLLDAIRGEIVSSAETLEQNAQKISLVEFDQISSEAKDKVLDVSSFVIRPQSPTTSSYVSVKVIVGNVFEFIDFGKTKAIYRINNGTEYYQKPVLLDYNGEIVVYLGRATVESVVDVYFLFESFSRKKQLVGPVSVKIGL